MADQQTPRELGYRWPAEWEIHQASWFSWPHNRDSWPGKFEPVPPVFSQFVRTVADFEPVHILADGAAFDNAAELVGDHPQIRLHRTATNDCWIRDHGPWFLQHTHLPPALVNWEYNAWGGKYPPFEDDNAVPGFIAEELRFQQFVPGLIMEGGSVENNGAGVLLVTSQCLLNPNRNSGITRAEIEQRLCDNTGANEVWWLFNADDGSIPGDDTDAHIDQLARFVSTDTIVYASNEQASAGVNPVPLLEKMKTQLELIAVERMPNLQLIPLPLPEPVLYEGHQLPASYANFYVGNGFVIVPQFRCSQDKIACDVIQNCYPQREIIGIDAVDLIWGLGAFHCASMQQGVSRSENVK